MNKITLSLLKRTILYPLIVGSFAYYMTMEFDPETRLNFLFLIETWNHGLRSLFMINFSDSFLLLTHYYFIGYLYGLISTVWSVRKFRRNGSRLGILPLLIVWCSKIALTLFHVPFGYLILVIDLIISFTRVAFSKKKAKKQRARNQPSFEDDLYYEESHR